MNKHLLDDNAEINFGESNSLSDLALNVKSKIQESDVLFIFVNLRFHKSIRTEQTGIELFIWLRLKGVMNHCVLVSFETLHTLLNRQPKHLIIASTGTSFMQHPIDLSNIDAKDLSEKRAEPENLKIFFKTSFNIQEFRHAYANIWGLRRLVEAHKLVCPEEDLKFNTNDVSKTVNYHIAEYIFKSPRNPIDNYTIRIAKEVLNNLKLKSGVNILYIDDQADNGWYDFLRSLFHKDVRLHKFDLGTNDFNKLYEALSKFIFNNSIDLIISDLRLFAHEDEVLDYDDFVSIKLMKQIRSKKESGRLVFPNLSYMLFTATNKLTYYKSMIKGKVFAPQGLFIKEGLDLLYNETQSFNNYFQLIKTLDSFFAVYKRKQGEMVELWDEEECRKTFALENSIKNNLEKNQQFDIATKLSDYTHVIADTNIYMGFHNIPLSLSKCYMTYPVYRELLRNAKDDYSSCKGYLAKYFTDNFQPDKSCLSENDLTVIERKFNSGINIEDLADDYFVRMLSYYAATPNSKVLFITNDWKDKGDKISAGNQVKKWIKKDKIQNVKVIYPNELLPSYNRTSSFNQSKNKFNRYKSNSQPQSNENTKSIPNNSTITKILRTEKDFLIVEISNSNSSCYIDLLSSRLKSVGNDNNFNILIGLPVKRNNTTKSKMIDNCQYVNINVNNLKAEVNKKLNNNKD